MLDRPLRFRALLALVASAVYLSVVVVPDLGHFALEDLGDITQIVPIGYFVVVFIRSITCIANPVTSRMRSHVLMGVFEAAVVTVCLVALFAVNTFINHGLDGTARWIAFYVSAFYLIPAITIPLVAGRLLIANWWR